MGEVVVREHGKVRDVIDEGPPKCPRLRVGLFNQGAMRRSSIDRLPASYDAPKDDLVKFLTFDNDERSKRHETDDLCLWHRRRMVRRQGVP